MVEKVGIEIQNTRDTDPSMLAAFFETAGNFRVKRNQIAARGDAGIVQMILLIMGPWAAERYVLDPLADKLEEWTKAITSLKGKQFKVSVNFQEGRFASIETFRLSSPLIVGNVWQVIKSASDLLASHAEGIPLDRMLIVPGKLDEPLVIGYQGIRPTHLLDITSKRVLPINSYDGKPMGEIEGLVSALEALRATSGGRP